MTGRNTVGPLPTSSGPAPALGEAHLETLHELADGLTAQQIARAHCILERAAQTRITRLLEALGADTAAHAVHLGHMAGLLTAPRPRASRDEVPAYTTVRLLRALVAAGWTVEVIGRHMGMGQPEVSVLMRRDQVTVAMEQRVQLLFLRLVDVNPLENGVHQRGYTRARNRAVQEGWTVLPAEAVAAMRQAVTCAA